MKLNPFVFPSILFALCITAATGAVINGVDFDFVYDGSALPQQSTPPWVSSSSAITAQVNDGIFTLTTGGSNQRYYHINHSTSPEVWNGGSMLGTTVEFSMRVIESTGNRSAAAVTIGGTSRYFIFNFTDSKIFAGNTISPNPSLYYDFDTTEAFNTYRIVVKDNLASLYINNSTEALISDYGGAAHSSLNTIRFGSASPEVSGTTEWDYVAFTNKGGFAPIPEPRHAVAWAAVLAIVGVLWKRRRCLDA